MAVTRRSVTETVVESADPSNGAQVVMRREGPHDVCMTFFQDGCIVHRVAWSFRALRELHDDLGVFLDGESAETGG